MFAGKQRGLFLLLIGLGVWSAFYIPSQDVVVAQQPTGSIPTVTGTPTGMIVRVNFDLNVVNVYSGPSSYLYPSVGVLLKGQEVPAIGVSEDNNWIQVYYPGIPGSIAWVYSPYVTIIKTGRLPRVQAPSTPTPLSTPTINPSLAAAFIDPSTPTRLPTFTPPPELIIPTFLPEADTSNRIPVGLLIVVLGFIGAFGALISFLRGN
ncbi:MAG: SH3 domain-containing protein [Anaerolineales bacterium]|nr:SH3 domain-containing protein [Anaerolineales bacterium]